MEKIEDVKGGDVNLKFNCGSSLICSSADFLGDLSGVICAFVASSDYFNLIERKPQMNLTNSIEKPLLSNIRGNIEFNKRLFTYFWKRIS